MTKKGEIVRTRHELQIADSDVKIEDLMGVFDVNKLPKRTIYSLLLDTKNYDITDIKFDGAYLIVESGYRGKFKIRVNGAIFADIKQMMDELERINDKILNIKNPYLDLDVIIKNTDVKLRFSILHETLTNIKGVKSFAIRRNIFSKPVLNDQNIIDSVDGNERVKAYIQKLIYGNVRPNIIISGETGCGKTELQKYIIGQISNYQGVVSIQDTNDAALKKLYPQKDITEIFSNKFYSLSDGIKTSLRYNPDWVLVSEIRGEEITSFIEAMDTGHSAITTIHASSAPNTIDRMNNLAIKYGKVDVTDTLNNLIDIVIHLKVFYVTKRVEGKPIIVKRRLINEIYDVKKKELIFKYKENNGTDKSN